MTHATHETRRVSARPLAVAAVAALLACSFAGQSLAAAKAPDIDPSRYSIGNIVYPPGVKPAPGTETLQNGKVVTDKTSTAITIQPKSKARHKPAQ